MKISINTKNSGMRIAFAIILILLLSLTFAGCNRTEDTIISEDTNYYEGAINNQDANYDEDSNYDEDTNYYEDAIHNEDAIYDNEEFILLLDELFAEIVTSESISLNFFLANPATFGIEGIEPTLGEVTTLESFHRSIEEDREFAERLRAINFDLLCAEKQLVFNILMRNFEITEQFAYKEDFAFYRGWIRPLVGIQVQLPVLLAEFNFRTEEDFEIYFALLGDTERYFNDIIEFERERSRRGFFMADGVVDMGLEHIESFVSDTYDNFMILVFEDNVNAFEGLSQERRNELIQRNRDLILEKFLPAYENLANALRELRGIGAHDGGLVLLPGGEILAQAYLRQRTDSDLTIQEMYEMLTERLNEIRAEFMLLFLRYPELGARFVEGLLGEGMLPHLAEHTAENFMIVLRDAISEHFPPLDNVRYTIHEIHESMQEHMSPAFFLRPAIDDFENNVIYVNPRFLEDKMFFFTIMAHEGFPGHMYQMVYFLQQGAHPVRQFIVGIGYTEGWATHAEMMSYSFAGLGAEAEFLRLSREFDLMLSARLDIGINGLGWDINESTRVLGTVGLTDSEIIESIFNSKIGIPLFSVPYAIGYLEMRSLLEKAEEELADDFNLLEFHRFILDFGPAPFPMLREGMSVWMEEFASAA